jgi:hypothetical protein
MAALFNPPDHSQKPEIPAWVPPPKPTEDLDYAKLHTIELALVDSPDPAVRAKLIEVAKEAIRDDGFLYLTNYGVSLEQVRPLPRLISLILTCSSIDNSALLTSSTETYPRRTRTDYTGTHKAVYTLATNLPSDGE